MAETEAESAESQQPRFLIAKIFYLYPLGPNLYAKIYRDGDKLVCVSGRKRDVVEEISSIREFVERHKGFGFYGFSLVYPTYVPGYKFDLWLGSHEVKALESQTKFSGPPIPEDEPIYEPEPYVEEPTKEPSEIKSPSRVVRFSKWLARLIAKSSKQD